MQMIGKACGGKYLFHPVLRLSVFLSQCNLAHIATLPGFLIYFSPLFRHRAAFWSPYGAFTRRLFHIQIQAVPSLSTDGCPYGITLCECTMVYSTGPLLVDFEVICNLLPSQTMMQDTPWATCHWVQAQESQWDKLLVEKLLGQTVVPL